MHAADLHPYDLLRDLERRYQRDASGLPQQREIRKPWTGIGFNVGGTNFVAPVGDVREILYYPRLTQIPGTKSWVRGMANVRGTLIPIIDLKHYLGHPPVEIHARSRVLVIQNGELWAGLLVDSVSGLKHFHEDHARTLSVDALPGLKSYLKGQYQFGDIDWYVFSFRELVENPEFIRIAA